jgi:dihydrofolate synthase/folylpolyglutamate synthase
MNLDELLGGKPLYYTVIDHERVKKAFGMIRSSVLIPKVIQVVGTNGKGSTGRMMAHMMSLGGTNVGHYTSPHILKFNERYWLNGKDCDDSRLEIAHERLFALLPLEVSLALSYFEYTTLLSLFVFEECEYIVLETGMGGEFDATSVIPKILSVITPIDIDHQAFLGNDIESIATTKLKSIDKLAVIAPQIHSEIENIAIKVTKDAKLIFVHKNEYRDEINVIAKENLWGDFLVSNANTACKALDVLNVNYDINSLKSWSMIGRYFAYNSNIRLDVGHNLLAAKAIYNILKEPVVLIYNTLEDKPYREILELLKPKIKEVLIIDIETQRALNRNELLSVLDELEIKHKSFTGEIDTKKKYLVFGSFSVVEAFLKIMDAV